MFSQQKRGIIKPIPIGTENSLEMSIENSKTLNNSYRHPHWKFALVEPILQSQLGVVSGDTILLRVDMLSKSVACIVANYYPISDIGMNIIRLSKFAMDKLNIGKNDNVLVERWDKIYSKKIILEYFIPNRIKNELKLLPIALHDYFETSVNLDSREEPLNVDYWIKRLSPDFPITTVTKETNIIVKSRAKRIHDGKLKNRVPA